MQHFTMPATSIPRDADISVWCIDVCAENNVIWCCCDKCFRPWFDIDRIRMSYFLSSNKTCAGFEPQPQSHIHNNMYRNAICTLHNMFYFSFNWYTMIFHIKLFTLECVQLYTNPFLQIQYEEEETAEEQKTFSKNFMRFTITDGWF